MLVFIKLHLEWIQTCFIRHLTYRRGLLGGASDKDYCQHRRLERHKFDPWVGKITWEGNGNPLWYSCLENSVDRGARGLQSMGSQSWTWLSTHNLQKICRGFLHYQKVELYLLWANQMMCCFRSVELLKNKCIAHFTG